MTSRSPAERPSARERYPGQGRLARWFYVLSQLVTMWASILLYRARRAHKERVPRSGPLVVVCNHQSHFDPPLVSHVFLHRALHFFARDSLFDVPVLGWLIRRYQSFPVKRGEADTAAICEALARPETGAAVLLFPEGTRSKDGSVGEFKRGALLLLRKAKCPVLPVAIDGPIDAFPRSKKWPRLIGVRIATVVGEPIEHAELFENGPDAALERLRREVVALKEEASALRSR